MKVNKRIKKSAKSSTGITSILPAFEFMETIDLAIRFIFTIVAIMLTALFFIFIYDYATQSTYFTITKISIHGLNRLTENQALAQAQLHPGDNLLNINTFKIKKRLVAHPWILSARITRKLPHGLEISIQEEIPLARVDMGKPPSLIINTEGIAFTPYDPEKFSMDMELPVIKGLTLEKKQVFLAFTVIFTKMSLACSPMISVSPSLPSPQTAPQALPLKHIFHPRQTMNSTLPAPLP